MSPEAGIEEVTEQCPDCPATFTGPATGPGSAKWQLGTHRFRSHGYRNPNGKAKKVRTDDRSATVTAIRAAGEAARGTGRSRTGAPNAEELSRGIGRFVQTATIVAASYAAETDPGLTTEAERTRMVMELSIGEDTAADLVQPLGKMLAPTGVNKRYGRTVIENVDAGVAIGELIKIGLRWRRYFAQRAQAERRAQEQPVAPGVTYQAPEAPAQAPPPNPAPPIDVVAEEPTFAPEAPPAFVPAAEAPPEGNVQAFTRDGHHAAPVRGTLVTPAMIQAMKAGA